MKTKAIRLHGAMDIRFEEFDLPEITDEEVLIEVISDTVCASTYKAVKLGTEHKRVPADIAEKPVIIGHEMCGRIIKVGKNATGNWKEGEKVVVQPALKLENGHDPGYSYQWIGGNSQYAIVPKVVLERGCLLHYKGKGYYEGSLVEPLSCILRAYKGSYHTDYTNYIREDGAKKGGKLAILGGGGPMGIGAIELAIGYAGVKEVVVTDLSEERLDFAAKTCSVYDAEKRGVKLTYVNTSHVENVEEYLKNLSDGGFDDVFVMVAVSALFTLAERICKEDGCINLFAGSPDHNLQGSLNLYRVHYDGIHVVGTAGGIPEDTMGVINLIEDKKINAGALVSHIMGLSAAKDAILAMEKPFGAKKVCYNGIDLSCVAISDFGKLGESNPLFKKLDEIVKANGGQWCAEAENYLLQNAPKL